MKPKKNFLSIIGLLLILGILPLLLLASQTVQQLFTQATGKPANLVIDTNTTLEPIKPVWNSYAQGGEESKDMLAPVVPKITPLAPRYIRIDHVFDHFNVVDRDSNGTLTFNFSQLDQILTSIKKTGAIPFISLSYLPPVIATGGDITGIPVSWNEWSLVVTKIIEHVSGRGGLNLVDVYYEVWNEPDLFGNWKYYGEKNYLTLYEYAVLGANKAQNTQNFKIGGPATTKLYKNWVTALAKYASERSLRLDFFSWHLYSKNPKEYGKNVADVTSWLFAYPTLVSVPRIISEWGFDSNINGGYDTQFAAAHAAAVARQTLVGYEQLLAFELVDGKSPENKQFWGRWGLLTHPDFGASIKPRYQAFSLLNQMTGKRLLVKGEGTWVTAFASRDKTTKLLVVNYDAYATHAETVPVTLTNLVDGKYILKKKSLRTQLGALTQQDIEVTGGSFATQLIMPANTITYLELVSSATASAQVNGG